MPASSEGRSGWPGQFTIIGTPRRSSAWPWLAPEVTIRSTEQSGPGGHPRDHVEFASPDGPVADGSVSPRRISALQRFWPAVLEATTNAGMRGPIGGALSRAVHFPRTRTCGLFPRQEPVPGAAVASLGLVTLLLAVACASAANLLLARGVARQREIAVAWPSGRDGAAGRQMLTDSPPCGRARGHRGSDLAYRGAGALVSLLTTSQERSLARVSLETGGCSRSRSRSHSSSPLSVPGSGAPRRSSGSGQKPEGRRPDRQRLPRTLVDRAVARRGAGRR